MKLFRDVKGYQLPIVGEGKNCVPIGGIGGEDGGGVSGLKVVGGPTSP